MDLHELLTQKKVLIHVSSTGAGPALQKALWETPGASNYLVGFFTPYVRTQLHSFLGHEPEDSYVSEDVALDMAMSSYIRAAEYSVAAGVEGDPLGVGITAAVASSYLPRGDQRVFVAVVSKDKILCTHFVFEKGVGKEVRISHDEMVSKIAIDLIRAALDGSNKYHDCSDKALERFYRYPIFKTNGTRHPRSEGGAGAFYLPATLNPIHDGHRSMCDAAEEALSPSIGRVKASYLVSSMSPHKGSLSVQEMLFKAGMLRAERWLGPTRSVEFTHDEPLFIDKARKRPGSIFLIGADTMQRLLDPCWGTDIPEMLVEMYNLGVKFFVMERIQDGKVIRCEDVEVPNYGTLKLKDMGLFSSFGQRIDISSSELRK